jgi:hypothetical protein
MWKNPLWSTIDNLDVVTNFESIDRISVGDQSFDANIERYSGRAKRLNANQIDRALGGSDFLPGQVAAIRVDDYTSSFVVVNNNIPGFQASEDTIIALSGYRIDAMNPVVVV